jgi:hypothetical protein
MATTTASADLVPAVPLFTNAEGHVPPRCVLITEFGKRGSSYGLIISARFL